MYTTYFWGYLGLFGGIVLGIFLRIFVGIFSRILQGILLWIFLGIFSWTFLGIILGNDHGKFCGDIFYTTVIWLAVSILKGCSNSGGD